MADAQSSRDLDLLFLLLLNLGLGWWRHLMFAGTGGQDTDGGGGFDEEAAASAFFRMRRQRQGNPAKRLSRARRFLMHSVSTRSTVFFFLFLLVRHRGVERSFFLFNASVLFFTTRKQGKTRNTSVIQASHSLGTR